MADGSGVTKVCVDNLLICLDSLLLGGLLHVHPLSMSRFRSFTIPRLGSDVEDSLICMKYAWHEQLAVCLPFLKIPLPKLLFHFKISK